MIFRWLNNQGVESDRGFTVQTLDRFTIEYREAGNQIRIPVENAIVGNTPCVSIDPASFKRWDGMPLGRELPVEKQREMLANLVAAMEFQGVEVIT